MAYHLPLEVMKYSAIIAVMGLPYTFRKEMGTCIALWAKGPNLKFEVIHDALLNENDVGAKEDDAFNVLFRTALSQLRWNPSKCVVIDFPIPSKCKSQLEKLLSLFEHGGYVRRLLIIECRMRNKFRWQTYVEDVSSAFKTNFGNYYYTETLEPGEWKEVEKAILEHQQQRLDDTYFLNLSTLYPRTFVSRMVVDTFEDLRSRDFTEDQGLNGRSLFAEAIKCLLTGDYNEYQKPSGMVDYALWRRQWLDHKASSRGSSSSERSLCDPGDCILRFAQNLQAEDIICGACDEKVTEGAYYYYCQLCSLSLHESCGTPSSTRPSMHMIPRSQVIYRYSLLDESEDTIFPKTYACHSCEKEGKRFSWACNACIFRTHLKCQLLPTALKHSCDQDHILSIRMAWIGFLFDTVYDCKACGLKGICSSYSCNICNSEYHLQCLLELPLHTKDVGHGGHMHSINIQFSCGAKEDEYEWCCVCYREIDPEIWVYTCKDCDYVAHLFCIFPSRTFESYKVIT